MVMIMKLNYALRFAYEKHKDQKRKLTNESYFFHPLEVALTVAQYTDSIDTIIAAVLHDTLEDTDTVPEEIKSLFGDKVLSIILECSEHDKELPWKERKEKMIEAYPSLSKEACLIVLSDKICNLKNIKFYYNDHIWNNFNAGYDDQKWVSLETLEALKKCPNQYPELIKQFEELIHIVFR